MTESAPWTVRRLLEWTAGFFTRKEVDAPRLSAELLLAHVLGVPRIKLYTGYENVLPEAVLGQFRALVKRAGEHEPIAYLTGKAHFFNLEVNVTRDVLIPRPETETLVEHVLQMVRHESGMTPPRVLDLCTGSGCIAAAIATNLKSASVVATDISEKALEVARGNIEKLGLVDRVMLGQGDLYGALERVPDPSPFNMIVANPPYIPSGAIPKLDKNVREYEPMGALDGGPDGLDPHRKILAGAAERLLPNGRVYLEIAFDQGEKAIEIAGAVAGLEEAKVLKDYGGRDRVLMVKKRG